MDLQKAIHLQATSDVQHIAADTFLLNGHLADLYLYPSELRILQRSGMQVIPIDFSLTFSIICQQEEPIGIELNTESGRIQLLREFWPRGNEWQDILLANIKRKNFHQFFKPLKQIGKGNFATVYLAQDLRKGRKVAIKAFQKIFAFKGQGQRGIENQIGLLRQIDCEHIVKLYGVYQTQNSLYLSMEYIDGITLEAFLRRRKPSPDERRRILKALLIALREMRKLRIVHRDIKPENIIVSKDLSVIKVLDLGLATNIDEPSYIFVRCGTPGYIAPQILKIKDLPSTRLCVESDMFSLGAIYYRMIYGKSLFSGRDQTQVLQSNRACEIKIFDTRHAAYGELELLASMLSGNPQRRATPEQALRTPFLRERQTRSSRKVLASLDSSFLMHEVNCVEG